MSFYQLPSTSEVPDLTLVRWSIQRTTDGDHVVGINIGDGEGRTSTAIKDFDPASATATTASGRRYALQDGPGQHPDADYVWALWRRVNGVTAWTDVSAEYAERIKEAGAVVDVPVSTAED